VNTVQDQYDRKRYFYFSKKGKKLKILSSAKNRLLGVIWLSLIWIERIVISHIQKAIILQLLQCGVHVADYVIGPIRQLIVVLILAIAMIRTGPCMT
jgi:hypothetical protein